MGKYDTAVRCAQIRSLIEENQYLRAMEEIEEIQFDKVPSIADLYMFAEIFLKAEKMDIAKELYYTVYRRTASRPALYRLLMLVIRMGDVEEAKDLYLTYEIIAGITLDTYELRYRLAKAEGASHQKLIEILEQLKKDEYTEEWGYQLARLYEIEGMRDKCVEECEEIQRWFGSGAIVDKATKLKEKCMSPSWVKPELDKIPEPEQPDLSEAAPVFAHAPVTVEDILVQEKEPEKQQEETADLAEESVEPAILAEEPKTEEPAEEPKTEESVAEEPSVLEEEAKAEEAVTDDAEEEPASEEAAKLVEESAEEPTTQAEEPSTSAEESAEPAISAEEPKAEQLAAEEPSVEEPTATEEQTDDVEEETEQEEESQVPQRKGFLKRLVNYFKVDFDDLDEEDNDEEEEFPQELDTYKQQSTAEIDVKAILAEGVDGILDVPEETQAAGAKTAADAAAGLAEELDKADKSDKALPENGHGTSNDEKLSRTDRLQVESLEDKLEEMEKHKKVINLEDTLNLEEVQVKSHPLGKSESTEMVEDTSRNGIRYFALKGAIQRMRLDEGCINIALTGGAEGISLAVAKKLFKELKKINYFEAKNIGKISADKFEEVDLEEWAEKFIGGCMYITDAPCLSQKSIGQIVSLIERYRKQIVIILEGDYDEMDQFLCHNKELEKRITYKVKL